MKHIHVILISLFNFIIYANDVMVDINVITDNADTLYKPAINLSFQTRVNIYALRFDLNFNDDKIKINENEIIFMNEHSNFYAYKNNEDIYEIIVMGENGKSLIDATNEIIADYMTINFSSLDGFNDKVMVEIFNFNIFGFSGIELSHDLISDQFFQLSFMELMKTKLHPNNPNPFKNATTITYEIADTSMVLLSVYDTLGEPIDTLVNGLNYPDKYKIMWHALDHDNKPLPSGKYIISLETQNYNDMIKMTILR